ncbi:cell division protein FtsH [Candidatus Cerribacteria bacterium 'Amazon FNV 2010 28 9']|uniref:ATP-dependent zinc metalloprotease FtsH n=1 Tax=Candidatus Cerribacteria bacterium 'Amazon FNV 2010 28 9' TaxID=2081795 RepID=A0A317JNM0_9BACT|nr:MAG: cell division protein FtsH [Candidatus Cerribacteria bacterium 'Amazon FNV 2010 28 9']
MYDQENTPAQNQNQKKKQAPKNRRVEIRLNFSPKKAILWFLLFLLFVPFILTLLKGNSASTISLSSVLSDAKSGKIDQIEVNGATLNVKYKDGSMKFSRKEDTQNLTDVLRQADVDLTSLDVTVKEPLAGQFLLDLLGSILPTVLMVVFFLIILRQARGAQGDMMGFGKSKAKLFSKGKQDVKFSDVGGLKEAKQELEEIVDFLKNPKKYSQVGARTPKGVLLVGPAGTGKTLLARAVAGEANVPFFSMAGSEFMEMLVGVGASRVRDLFDTAKKSAPCIIFIDEIDAIGQMRGRGSMGGHDEREQTLNQILVEMDGFQPNETVIVLAATNRADLLDPALVRPGRFDRRVTLDLPDLDERKYVLSIHAKNKPFAKDVQWDRVAKRTVGFSGADLENMLNEAAITVARENRKEITAEDIENAALKVKLGPEKKKLQSQKEREMTAYHEAGHAIVTHFLPHTDPVHRISIVSRGRALGFTMTPPEQDKYQQTKPELEEQMSVMLGGRAAEQFIFKELTGGVSSDLDRVTRIARAMVMDYGMSELAPINYGPMYDYTDYGRAMMEPYTISDKLKEKVDAEVSRFVDEAWTRALTILKKQKKHLDAVAKRLLEVESMDQDEFEKMVGPKVKAE